MKFQWTTSTGKTSEQYYLTVNKGSNVSSATSSQWVNKGSSVNVTATAATGYVISGGTGSTGAMNTTKTVSVTARWATTLTIKYHSSEASNRWTHLSKVRVYSSSSSYTDYTPTFTANRSPEECLTKVAVYPGCKIILYSSSAINWNYHEFCGDAASSLGYSTLCASNATATYITVPSNANNDGYFYMNYNTTYGCNVYELQWQEEGMSWVCSGWCRTMAYPRKY